MNRQHPQSGRAPARSGFTLTELLVATALTVLVMLMFAQIYGAAIGSMRQQRSLARNDQHARAVSSVIRSDFQHLTTRQPGAAYGNVRGIVPLAPGDQTIIDPLNQRGYFYFSENDPAIDWDDVLQFTVMVNIGERGEVIQKNQQRPFVGRAANLGIDNEPDDDDGVPDNLGSSRAAEVCYFLRNGNLYRRVFLLRDPLAARPARPEQPSDVGVPEFSGTGTPNYAALSFYANNDYAATRRVDGAGISFLWWHGTTSLDNSQGASNHPLAMTGTRFGFNPATLLPREYTDSAEFFGRFTAEETSHDAFTYPAQSATVMNPYTAVPSLNSNLVVPTFAQGALIGEDILLTNVEAFDVKVWDTGANLGAGAFVSIGDNDPLSDNGLVAVDYLVNNLNAAYNNGAFPNIFDTWHPTANSAVGTGSPPFRPVLHSAPGARGAAAAVGDVIAIRDGSGNVLHGGSFVYKCVVAGLTATVSPPPEFPPVAGNIVQDGTVIWQCVDNRIGLQAIQITVRYRDSGTNLPRQVTIAHSFVE